MNEDTSTGVWLVRALEALGVETVFGIPGVHTLELYRGLAQSTIRHITPRHEQAAGFMADGYARAGGRPGVCFVISGPGLTNIATAMAQAYAASVPMLVISTVNAQGRMGSGEGWLHELKDQRALAEGVAALSRTIHAPGELPSALLQAFALFATGRPRPVHLEIPINVLNTSAGSVPLPSLPRLFPPAPNAAGIAEAAARLASAQAPVILVGGGAKRALAVVALAEALDAPVVMTTQARGLLPPEHPLGVSLSPSMPETRKLISEADVVLALGTELGPTDYDMYEDGGFAIPGFLIRVDIDPCQLVRGSAANLALLGDAAQAAKALLAAGARREPADGARRAQAARAGQAHLPATMRADLKLLELVRDTLPDSLLVGDSTQLVYAGNIGFAATRPGGWFNSATGFGALGYGLPAAIGASLADERPVVAFVGDGGLMYCLGELATASEAGARAILLVLLNGGYGEIRSAMLAKNISPLGVDLYVPDLAAVARACGWSVACVHAPEMLRTALREAARRSGPSLILFDAHLRAALASDETPAAIA